MSKAQRDKGLRGELEVKHAFQNAGFEVRDLEGQGDNLIVCSDGVVLHIEVKRQEKIQIDKWSNQAESEAPMSAQPVVVYRRSRQPWRASMPLESLILLLRRVHALEKILRPPSPTTGGIQDHSETGS